MLDEKMSLEDAMDVCLDYFTGSGPRDVAVRRLLEGIHQADHQACQIKDALDELRKGAMPPGWRGPFIARNPLTGEVHVLQASQVSGFYEAFVAKIRELGDFSRVDYAERKLVALRQAVRAFTESKVFGGVCDEECDLEEALKRAY